MEQLQVYESEAREAQAAEEHLGPQCADCGKNLWKHVPKGRGAVKVILTPEMGGCACPPFAVRKNMPTVATLEERSTLALENIGRLLEAFATAQKIAVPEAPAPVPAVKAEVPTTGTPIDGLRAKQQKAG
jgi:hypothetical protein